MTPDQSLAQDAPKPTDTPGPADRVVFNGIDAETGDYLFAPATIGELARGDRWRDGNEGWLRRLKSWFAQRMTLDFPVAEGVDPHDVGQAGWGVVFGPGIEPAVHEALRPLLDHRKAQAGDLYVETRYLAGMDSLQFLQAFQAAPGAVDPTRIPYYVLLVGSPSEIPLSFQYQLDVQYAVGRLHFDTPEEYARYAENVVTAERAAERSAPGGGRAAFWGVRNRGDRATEGSHDQMMVPLADTLTAALPGWRIERALGRAATRARLTDLVSGPEAPDLLFTASHGMGFTHRHPRQREIQGAPLCQDWPGVGERLAREHYLAAEDLPAGSGPAPSVMLLFACYGGATPAEDDFWFRPESPAARQRLAEEGFVSRLPQRLLERGTLAVVAHADRAWSWSFRWGSAGPQLKTFESTLRRLAGGAPVGYATEYLDLRYAEIATHLDQLHQRREMGLPVDPIELAGLWTAGNDARNYVVLGDPAVRIGATTG